MKIILYLGNQQTMLDLEISVTVLDAARKGGGCMLIRGCKPKVRVPAPRFDFFI